MKLIIVLFVLAAALTWQAGTILSAAPATAPAAPRATFMPYEPTPDTRPQPTSEPTAPPIAYPAPVYPAPAYPAPAYPAPAKPTPDRSWRERLVDSLNHFLGR